MRINWRRIFVCRLGLHKVGKLHSEMGFCVGYCVGCRMKFRYVPAEKIFGKLPKGSLPYRGGR